MKPVTRWRQWFVGPVPVAVTTVRLVREAEIQLSRPRLHLIPLELRSRRPRPITLVSLQGRLPNLQTSFTGDPQWLLDAQNATPNRLEDSQSSSVISLQITQTRRLKWCLILFGSGWLGLYPRKEFSLNGFEVGCSHTTIAVLWIWAANHLWL